MFTALGGLYVLIFFVPIVIILFFIWLIAWISLKIATAWLNHKEKQRQAELEAQRKAKLNALLKQEHECWLKLTNPEHSLSAVERINLEYECTKLRDNARLCACLCTPCEFLEFPPL